MTVANMLERSKEIEAQCQSTLAAAMPEASVQMLSALDNLIEAKMVRFKLEMLVEQEEDGL